MNGDGKPDVVVANQVLLGNGDGTFQLALNYNSGVEAQSLAIADVNGDGNTELLVAGCSSVNGDGGCANGAVSAWLANGDGTFQPAVIYGSGVGSAEALAIADVNGDGRPDLLVADFCSSVDSDGNCTNNNGAVSVLLGNGDGTFQPAVSYGWGGQLATSVAVADLNGDGRPDVVVANDCPSGPSEQDNDLCQFGSYTVVGVLLGNGDGTFQPVSLYNSGGR